MVISLVIASVGSLDVVLDAPLEVGVVVRLDEGLDLGRQVGLVRLVRLGLVGRLGLVRRLGLVGRRLVAVVLPVLRLRLPLLPLDLN